MSFDRLFISKNQFFFFSVVKSIGFFFFLKMEVTLKLIMITTLLIFAPDWIFATKNVVYTTSPDQANVHRIGSQSSKLDCQEEECAMARAEIIKLPLRKSSCEGNKRRDVNGKCREPWKWRSEGSELPVKWRLSRRKLLRLRSTSTRVYRKLLL